MTFPGALRVTATAGAGLPGGVAWEGGANTPIANQYGLMMIRAQFSIEEKDP